MTHRGPFQPLPFCDSGIKLRNPILECGHLAACVLRTMGMWRMTLLVRKPPDSHLFACVLERDEQNPLPLFRSCPCPLSNEYLYAKTVLWKTKINDTCISYGY